MVDFINKLIKFQKINIIVKPTLCLYKTENSQILICEDIKNKNKFCLKIILSQINNSYQLSSINTEIFLLQKMRNEENIVKLLDYTTITQYNFIFYLLLMEYCQYQTLYDLLKQNFNNRQILNDTLIYSYIYQIALGIKSIHKNGYYHRDLHPENILFKEKDKLVICDFGSATNRFYPSVTNNNINNNNLTNNILFEISNKTRLFYRAPEEISIYLNYPLSEKVDIHSLGIILFMMLLTYIPSLNEKYPYFYLFTSKRIKLEIFNEIKSLINPCFSELLENILQIDPNKRYNIDEVIAFLIAKENKISPFETKFKNEKNMFAEYFTKTLYEFEKQEINKNIYNITILVRNLLERDNIKKDIISEIPNNTYIDRIINKVNYEPRKIIKFYKTLFNSNVFFYNIYSVKMVYIMHYFIYNFNNNKIDSTSSNIFINNIDIFFPNNFGIDIILQTLMNFYNMKINNNFFDKKEEIKNIQINKFILLYCQFLLNKIILLKKHSTIISNDNTINVINAYKILSPNFVIDIFNLFISTYQLLISIPFNTNILVHIFDLITNILNQEIVSLCSILLTQLVALQKINKPPYFIDQFIDITLKTTYFFQKLKLMRKQIESKYQIIYFINSQNPDKKLKDFLNYIKNIKYDELFNVNEYFNPNSKIRKNLSYIPVKIVCYDPEAYKNDFPELNNNQNNKKNNEKEKNVDIFDKNNENKNNNKFNNNENISTLNNEIKNLDLNHKNNNKIIKNSKKNNINRNINNNSNNNSKNSNDNGNNCDNEEFNNFNQCFFDNNKETNEYDKISENKNKNIISDISSNLNIFSNLDSNFNFINKISIDKTNSLIDGNALSNLIKVKNPSTRVSSNFPGDSNQISEIKNEIKNKNNKKKVNNNDNDNNNKNIKKNINKNINIDNKKPEESKDRLYVMEEVLAFLNYEFSKPIFQFIINQNSIKIQNLLGYGGTSKVYLGNYRGTDVAVKKIKVKEINDNYFKEFKNEIVALTMIRHPNLIIFMGTMIENNNLCIITEYCKGGTLYDLLYKKKHIDIPWNLRLRILIDISKGMNFLHTNNPQIIHYDLKSLNILLTDEIKENSENNNITIKINDFGLSKIIDKEKIEWETPNGIVGSIQWMAPEVIQNNVKDNTKVDVYAFGIIIWEMCTRIQPYKDKNISQIINFVCNENGRPDCNLLPMDQMPKGLLELMENCWNTDPNLRLDFSSILYTLNKMQSLDE